MTRDNLNTQSRWLFYGQEVSPEAISADRGRSLTDEELEGNINVLECDNLFCSRCETRFALLESEYAKFYRGEKAAVNARVAYLFWLSVFWRMGVGRMSIFLDGEDEFAMRGYSKTRKDIERFVDMLEAQGYTDNDIRDNLRSKENE